MVTETKLTDLTLEDWEEIEAALWSKEMQIKNGDLGGEDHDSTPNGCHPDCEACENVRWIAHLELIQQKVEAIKEGFK